MSPLSRAEIEKLHAVDAIRQCCGQRPVPHPFTALHGRIGMIKNSKLITSPNATWIPEIQWQISAVGLHEDMRFGADDYTLYPQWFHPAFEFLPAIPKPPGRGEVSPYAIMWHTPGRGDFSVVEGSDVSKLPGYVHKAYETQLLTLYNGLLDEVERLILSLTAAQDTTTAARTFLAGTTCLRHAWIFLTTYAAAYEEKRLEFVEFQRAWLELKGMLNYYTWNRDRGPDPHNSTPRRTEACIGAIVENAHIAMQFLDMGVPVWLVREKMDVLQGDIYIEKPTSLPVKLGDHGEKASLVHDKSFPVIYTQNPQHALHYHVQHQFARIRSVVHRLSPTGQHVHTDIPHSQMTRRDASSILVDLQALRAQTSAGADTAAASSSSSTSLATTASSSSSSARSGNQPRGGASRYQPCKPPT